MHKSICLILFALGEVKMKRWKIRLLNKIPLQLFNNLSKHLHSNNDVHEKRKYATEQWEHGCLLLLYNLVRKE